MKDINKPIRKAFYELLSGELTYGGSSVPISDEKLKEAQSNNYYVILSSQSSTDSSTQQSLDREATIDLDIVTKTQDAVSKDIADDIANQIFTLLSTTPHTHNLPVQSGFQFLNLHLQSDRSLTLSLSPTQSTIRRILTFGLRVVF